MYFLKFLGFLMFIFVTAHLQGIILGRPSLFLHIA